MAASTLGNVRTLGRLSHLILRPFRQYPSSLHRLHAKSTPVLPHIALPSHIFSKLASNHAGDAAGDAAGAVSPYQDNPWDYLESEEYVERYGNRPVWVDYRRNHKGGIPPQRTRKTCIRGDKISGNPCPVCRDPNIVIHYQNMKLLQQFISPQTGMVYDPTQTGVCMKQQKKINEAITTAQNHGLLPFQIPHKEFSEEDYSTSHDAVGLTTPSLPLTSGDTWYKWYGKIEPDENEVAKVKKTYKAYLK